MNLICYPHYAAGGLLCNILNDPPNNRSHISADVKNLEHFLFIGDNNDVFDDFDENKFENQRLKALATYSANKPWLGTHCHPSKLNLENFAHCISITTQSTQSQLYRWLRTYNLYFKPQWSNFTGLERIDLLRETAKSYLKPFYQCSKKNLVQIELQDIVEFTPRFRNLCLSFRPNAKLDKVHQWLDNNQFLRNYHSSEEYQAFIQADYELSTNELYTYE